ncbi:MAG: MFS transporter [Polyangiaceae bacterium]|nr:MFS transporter [Polyangiaceae bacterium]
MTSSSESISKDKATRAVRLAIVVAALGYFVDIYDLVLFSIVRVASLKGIGVTDPDALLDQGVLLINMQMGGMLIGGILWGVIGDKRGRLSVLFGSILLYSVANILNGFVTSIETYAALRFIAGVGLAGELGAGITLVSEIMHKEARGYGTTIVASIGICGAVAAALIGDMFSWRIAYFVGGGLGLGLLVLRIGVYESGMFESVKKKAVERGNFFKLFSTGERARRYAGIVLIGIPIWYVVGILVTFSPEIGKAMGMPIPPNAGRAILYTYVGLAVGDLSSGALSQIVKSRKRAVMTFLLVTTATIVLYFFAGAQSITMFYAICVAMGFGAGYWAVFVTVASEQFGTNLRATATTSAPNLVRGAVVLLTLAFHGLKEKVGVVESAMIVGAVTIVGAFISLRAMEETYGKDLDYLEH